MSETNSATFNRNGTASYTRCYYTQSFGTAQGVLVSKNIPEKGLCGETITTALLMKAHTRLQLQEKEHILVLHHLPVLWWMLILP